MELSNPREAHHMTYFMAETYAVIGEYTTSAALWEEGLAWMRTNSDNNDVAWGLEGLGNLARVHGEFEQAGTLYRTGIQLKFENRQTFGILFSLSALAQLAVANEEPARAARLWGAADRIREQFWVMPMPYHTQFNWSDLSRAQDMLGEDAFRAAWAEGRVMTWEQAIAYALEAPREQTAEAHTSHQAAKHKFGGLTARERAVAARIAQGESNREIAQELVVSERTVETHVGNILNKLGFTSRAQIRKWVIERSGHQ
jgi:DNA-binding CsgD family transcriptional regulator